MDLESLKKHANKKVPKKLKIAGAVLFCLACVGVGYVGGYFTPRPATKMTSHQPANVTTAPPNAASWRDGPCPIVTNSQCPAGYQKAPPLLLVSFDGFRPEYLSRGNISAFTRLQECGVHAPSMRPSHPAITFPNHYSIATGLFTESHGIVDNTFFDPELGKFSYSSTEAIWWGGEPIWVTAKKQGKRAYSYFFVGNEIKIKDTGPDVFVPYNKSHPFELRVDTVLEWLSQPDALRPDITTLYFEEPDGRGHGYGTNSSEVNQMLSGTVNAALERLMQGLFDRNILQCINILVVSDHGMEDMSCDQSVFLQPVIDKSPLAGKLTESKYNLYAGVMGRISLNDSTGVLTNNDVYHALQCPAPAQPDLSSPYQLYRKADLPRRYHFTNTPRVEPTVVTVKAGHTAYKSQNPDNFCKGGMHGYDNLYPNMQAIFLAQGPSLKSGLTIEPFQNIELYNLMADLLNLEPVANNGTYGSLHHVLRSHKKLPDPSPGQLERPVFPDSVEEVLRRQGASCWIPCPGGAVLEADNLLNISLSDAARRLTITTPYGAPGSDDPTVLLANKDYAIGYVPALQLPAWASFSINEKTELTANSFVITCSRNDVRLLPEQTLTCRELPSPTADSLQSVYLFPPELATTFPPADDVRMVTNVVPMFWTFRTGIWAEFWKIIGLWSAKGWKLNIVTGPVFDSALPYGIADLPEDQMHSPEFPKLRIPSHYFAVVTRDNRTPGCIENDCLPTVLAFILPHSAELRSPCLDVDSYILTHSATVRDVEQITGLHFYADLPQYEAIRLRTQLPTQLWHKDHGL